MQTWESCTSSLTPKLPSKAEFQLSPEAWHAGSRSPIVKHSTRQLFSEQPGTPGMNLEQRQGCLISPFLLLRSAVPDTMSTLPSGIYFLASARFHLPQITTSSFGFKIEITIFNKWNASTCVPQVMSLCRNSLFPPRYWCCWLQGGKTYC